MPKYRKKFKEKTLDQMVTLLARMKPDQLSSLQKLSKHMQGHDVGYGDKHRTPYKKVLPGVWEDIQRAQHGTQLAGGILHEALQHKHDPHFHSGGGLYDGLGSLFHVGYNNLASSVEPLAWIQDTWDNMQGYKKTSQIPIEIKRQVDGIAQAKLDPTKRKDTLHGWTLDREASSGRVAVYVDQENKEVHAIWQVFFLVQNE